MKLKSWLIVVVAALLLETEYSKGETSISECDNWIINTNILCSIIYQHVTLKEIFAW
jgi:hypothetical protein